jgi:small subunit ribosomal protein S16
MVRLRLRRMGSKGQPSYRIVAAEREHPRDGRFLEIVGFYNPRTHPSTIEVDEGLALKWLKNGAQPSESVARLFKVTGTLDRLARLKGGEAVEALVAEAQAAAAQRQVNARTSGVGGASTKLSRKKKAAAEKKE